jgi:hypothetical protein
MDAGGILQMEMKCNCIPGWIGIGFDGPAALLLGLGMPGEGARLRGLGVPSLGLGCLLGCQGV